MTGASRREFLADVGRGMLVASVGPALAADLGFAPAWAAEEAPHHQGHKSVVCTSCWRIHLVNPVTGEVLDEGAGESNE